MAERLSDNVAMLMRVADRLAPLRDRLVFLGGAITELFITASGRRSSRHTKDVDVIINVINLGEYSEILREQLVGLGLSEDDREGAPMPLAARRSHRRHHAHAWRNPRILL